MLVIVSGCGWRFFFFCVGSHQKVCIIRRKTVSSLLSQGADLNEAEEANGDEKKRNMEGRKKHFAGNGV
ncbi:hypothetical protein VTJ04DRAFT_5047 [Mycothermus thermophilus]|uniref:uncharacterized protein n=1 Tax=Humicola insolens TaxID=85995 RepID=UPI003741F322